jgi:nucleoid DNA-binding protein|tara:strand:+ start:2926 stop:3300 length:375 start_codon:yes stop_codon:yes gene_type:complete
VLKNSIKPGKYRKFFKEVSEDCEVHENLVAELVRFFYSEVRKNLENLENTRILLPNLGTFTIRKNRLTKSITRHKDMLGNMEKTTYSGYGQHLPVKEKLTRMEVAKERLEKELQTKKDWKNENK